MSDDDLRLSQEIWETTTGGATYLNVRDPRNPRGWVQKKVGGKGSKRITITVEEREFNQDQVTYENAHLDPFTNGLLYRVQPKGGDRAQYEVNDEELLLILTSAEDEEFEQTIKNITSEVILRRLLFLAERNTTKWRYETLSAIVEERFAVGKTSRVVAEAQTDDARYAGADI